MISWVGCCTQLSHTNIEADTKQGKHPTKTGVSKRRHLGGHRAGSYRSSYGRLLLLPAWGLYDKDDVLVGSIRATSAKEARLEFKKAGLQGERVKRL